jgi:hypothetical protein
MAKEGVGMTAFYCSKEPLTEEQRKGLDLVGFDIDWHFAQYLKSFGIVGIGLPPFSEVIENEMQDFEAFSINAKGRREC